MIGEPPVSGSSRVAGVHAPAFVERARRGIRAASLSGVSPGFTPRPSLSVRQDVHAAEHHAGGVAGVHAPAFVER